jgi:hypothetical protein
MCLKDTKLGKVMIGIYNSLKYVQAVVILTTSNFNIVYNYRYNSFN